MRLTLHGGIAALVFAAGQQASAQGLPPAATDEIMAGARSCAAATSAAGVDPAKLEADGWRTASLSSNGKPLSSSVTFYGKGKLLLVFDKQQASPVCIITARLSSAADFTNLRSAFGTAFGTPIKDDGKGEQLFMAPDHRVVDLASTGTTERPAVRVAVGPVIQETK